MKFSSAFIAFAPLVAALPSLSSVGTRDDTPLTPGNLCVTIGPQQSLCILMPKSQFCLHGGRIHRALPSILSNQRPMLQLPAQFHVRHLCGPDQGQSCFFFMRVAMWGSKFISSCPCRLAMQTAWVPLSLGPLRSLGFPTSVHRPTPPSITLSNQPRK
jgi:hypothetical protein